MFKPDATANSTSTPAIDERITIANPTGQAPLESILGRAEFAVVPRLITAGIALALAVSTLLRGPASGPDWTTIGGAMFIAAAATLLAAAQRLPVAVRHRRTVWVYGVGAAFAFAAIASAAVHDEGVGSVAYTAAMPLAVYLGLVFPRGWRIPTIAALTTVTLAVQVANPATPILDSGVTLMLVLSAWTAGVLSGFGHARTSTVARRLSSFDQLTRMLNRRGLLVQVELAAAPIEGEDSPIALLVVDLSAMRDSDDEAVLGADRFGALGAARAADEDDLLRWAGATLPSALPTGAELGRIARNEFGVLLPGAPRGEAQAVAEHIRRLLAERVEAVVGAATSETRRVAPADLLRVAEAATKAARGTDDGFCALVAGTAMRAAGPNVPAAARPERGEALSYSSIRSTGEIPKVRAPGAVLNRLVAAAMFVVAACGLVIVTRTIFGDGAAFYDDVIRYLGVPWLFWVVGIGVTSLRLRASSSVTMRRSVLVHSQLAMSIGLAVAALSAGGITSAVAGALFIKVVFDSTILPPATSLLNLGIVLVSYAAVALLGPQTDLWVVPFHLALFAGSYALGVTGHRAHEQIAEHARGLGRTDDLTGLPDRSGFRQLSEAAFFTSATETGMPFGVVALRLCDLRELNASHGHATGDEALRAVADALREQFPEAHVIGRTGSGTFAICLPVTGAEQTAERATGCASALRAITPVTVGYATCPQDGATVPALLAAAEHRRQAALQPAPHATAH